MRILLYYLLICQLPACYGHNLLIKSIGGLNDLLKLPGYTGQFGKYRGQQEIHTQRDCRYTLALQASNLALTGIYRWFWHCCVFIPPLSIFSRAFAGPFQNLTGIPDSDIRPSCILLHLWIGHYPDCCSRY